MTGLATSLDGFIAGADDGPDQPLGVGGQRLLEWYFDGDTPSERYPQFRLSGESAAFFDEFSSRVGAVISGRRTYDISNAWGGDGPLPAAPLFVLTHRPPDVNPGRSVPYVFVTDGIESAVEQAKAAANGRDVALMGSAPVQQALRAGLIDVLCLHLVPVVLGSGVRLLDGLEAGRPQFTVERVINAPGVTHLLYRVG
jgi:dihydrofolate reductase